MTRASTFGGGLLVVCAALGAALALTRCGPDTPGGATGGRAADAENATFPVRYVGPRIWNDTVYYAYGEGRDAPQPYTGAILDGDGTFRVVAPPGAVVRIRNEPTPTAAERRMLWFFEQELTLPAAPAAPGETPPVLEVLPRAEIRTIAAADAPGPDVVTICTEDGQAFACAVRNSDAWLFLALWTSDGGTAYKHAAPPRPWTVDQFAPGRCTVAGRTEGRQWFAREADLSPGKAVDLPLGAQPEGGGTVICEDAGALLLLDGRLPVPSPRISTDLQFRARWKGVPPGAHKVRYPDGREVDVQVEDGKELRLGR